MIQLLKAKKYIKEIGWICIGQWAAFIGSFIGIKLLTTFLGTTGYGELSLGLTIAFIINQIVTGPISQAAYRFFSEYREKGKLNNLLAVIIKIMIIAILIIFVIYILSIVFLSNYLNLSYNWIILSFFSVVFGILVGCNSIFESMQNAARQRIIVAFHQGLLPWVRSIIAIIFIFFFGQKGFIAIIGYCIGLSTILISQFFFSKKLLNMI